MFRFSRGDFAEDRAACRPWVGIKTFLGAPRPFSLPLFLLIALALRVPAVLFAHGYEFVDQQYQSVDPAWHLATGDAWHRSWEWYEGIRSWVYPGLLAGMLRVARALGVDRPLGCLVLARLFHALLSLIPVTAFWLLVVRWRPVARPRPALLLFAASGILVFAGVQPSGPTFASTMSTAAVLLFIGRGRAPALCAGLCLGAAFCGRVQDAMLGPLLLAAGLWAGRRRDCLWLALGCVPPILLQGFVDLATWGTFLSSPFDYVRLNVFESVASKWRTRPFWYYGLVVIPALGLLPGLLRTAWQSLQRAAANSPLPLIAGLYYIGLHSLVARKSVRFVLPALALFAAVHAIGAFGEPATTRAARVHRGLLITLHTVLWLLASFVFLNRGPVLAATALGDDPAFDGTLVVVGGEETSIGGYANLRRRKVDVTVLRERTELAAWLSKPPAGRHYLMVTHEPLGPAELGPDYRLRPCGAFGDGLLGRVRDRRYLYVYE